MFGGRAGLGSGRRRRVGPGIAHLLAARGPGPATGATWRGGGREGPSGSRPQSPASAHSSSSCGSAGSPTCTSCTGYNGDRRSERWDRRGARPVVLMTDQKRSTMAWPCASCTTSSSTWGCSALMLYGASWSPQPSTLERHPAGSFTSCMVGSCVRVLGAMPAALPMSAGMPARSSKARR